MSLCLSIAIDTLMSIAVGAHCSPIRKVVENKKSNWYIYNFIHSHSNLSPCYITINNYNSFKMLIKVKVSHVFSNCIINKEADLTCNIYDFQTLTGKEIEIDIEPTDKVERIKERVEEKEGIPPQQQRLIFSGKQM